MSRLGWRTRSDSGFERGPLLARLCNGIWSFEQTASGHRTCRNIKLSKFSDTISYACQSTIGCGRSNIKLRLKNLQNKPKYNHRPDMNQLNDQTIRKPYQTKLGNNLNNIYTIRTLEEHALRIEKAMKEALHASISTQKSSKEILDFCSNIESSRWKTKSKTSKTSLSGTQWKLQKSMQQNEKISKTRQEQMDTRSVWWNSKRITGW